MSEELKAALVAVLAGVLFEATRVGWTFFYARYQASKVVETILNRALKIIEDGIAVDQLNSDAAMDVLRSWRDLRTFALKHKMLVYERGSESNLTDYIRLARVITDIRDGMASGLQVDGPFGPQLFIAASLGKRTLAKVQTKMKEGR